jgi:CHAD domain-containing protein
LKVKIGLKWGFWAISQKGVYFPVSQVRSKQPEKIGLPYWMDRVLQEHSKLGGELSPDPVHDLRVALRRCILIADVMREVDPVADWKLMRKTARRIFHKLGDLRDSQVLTEWIEKLRSPGDSSTDLFLESLKAKYEKDRVGAQSAIKEFDRKQWRAWMRELTGHYRHTASNRPACESLVFDIWETVLDLHRRAQKSRSRVAYHRLRGGFKKFRYAVENFLPSMYPGWAPDVKFMQDLLGEVHDLSVLEQAIAKDVSLSDETARAKWITTLREEQAARILRYRTKMAGKASPLWMWREGLPAERELRSSGLARLGEWGYFLTPDLPRVKRVARLSLQLYDGLANIGVIVHDSQVEERLILHAAALLQEVGHFKEGKAHHKQSYRMIRAIPPPAGWSKKELELTALIARFHRRALPRPDHKILKAYDLPLRHSLVLLAAILRFANALHAKPYRSVRRLDVEDCSGVIVVRADGFLDRDPLSPKLSVARRLLEFTCQRAVHILAPGTRMISTRTIRPATRPATRIDAA